MEEFKPKFELDIQLFAIANQNDEVIKTTLQIRDSAGNLIDVSKRIAKTYPIASQPSIIATIAQQNIGDGTLYPQKVLRDHKRKLKMYKVLLTTTGAGANPTTDEILHNATEFTHSEIQEMSERNLFRRIRTDSIIINQYDRMLVEKQYDMLAQKTFNFLLDGNETDLNELLKAVAVEATTIGLATLSGNNVIHTAQTKTGGTFTAVLNGANPFASTLTITDGVSPTVALSAVQAGERLVIVDKTQMGTTDAILPIIRSAIANLNDQGTPNSIENGYPMALNGHSLSDIYVLTNFKSITNLKSSLTTTFINMDNGLQVRNFNGLVGMIDTIPVYMTNQLPSGINYMVMTTRVLARQKAGADDLEFVGVLRDSQVALVNGVATQLSPADKVLNFEEPRLMGVVYPEECYVIANATLKA